MPHYLRRPRREARTEDRTVDDLTNEEVVRLLQKLRACARSLPVVIATGYGARALYDWWPTHRAYGAIDLGWLRSRLWVHHYDAGLDTLIEAAARALYDENGHPR